MAQPRLRILFVDDSDVDIEIERRQLLREGLAFEWRAARDERGLRQALEAFAPQVILSDYSIPGFSGRAALEIARDVAPLTPFIFVSGTIGEETAVECLRQGATDYVLKDNLRRLAPAVRRALAEAEERTAYEAQIRHLANYDALTGLPNRTLLHDRLVQSIVHTQRTGRALGVLVLNLDGFRRLNEGFGHSAADAVLWQVARRLEASVRSGDTVARLGSDEFAALLSDLEHAEDAVPYLMRLLDAVKAPLQVAQRSVSLTATAGAAYFPDDGHDADALLRAATAAMHRAKGERRGSFVLAGSPEATRHALHRVMIESALRTALERNELRLVYQLQYDLASGRPCGMEALMRWENAGRGEAPASFIPVAEESGQIRELGSWALRHACAQALPWVRGTDLVLGVNVSPLQLADRGFLEGLQTVLRETAFPAECLEVELTETALMRAEGELPGAIDALCKLGVHIAIDDFGTGYSSLAYLSRLPIERLKIDAGFVRRMATDPRDAKIVHSIVSLGHGLGLKVIAEGVETLRQAEMLRQMECDQVQGYLFAAPAASEEIAAKLG